MAEQSRTNEELRLRAWLHRIEEACAGRKASPKERELREAALAALRGEEPSLACAQLEGA